MEIWIVGGIIVALMIYASTKIKRLAADAYAREEIETDAFVIVKPEGFISPVESPYAFEARSKEFGEAENAEEMLRAHATVTIGDMPEPDSVTETERLENGVAIKEFRKVLSRNGRSFDLSVIVLADYLEEFEARVNEMIASFEVR